MKIDILTLFPEFIDGMKKYGVIGRGIENNLFEINLTDIRDYSTDKHKKVDDYSYGGGPGMVMTPQPLYDAIKSCIDENSYIISMSPRGYTLNQRKVLELSKKEHLIIICGHYEGIDQRVTDEFVDEEISIGDYILTGGEIPAMALVDSIARMLPDVLGNEESNQNESFENYLLEYDQYTRPEEYEGRRVPDVLLSGDHKEIEKFRLSSSIKITEERRPDLLAKYKVNNK